MRAPPSLIPSAFLLSASSARRLSRTHMATDADMRDAPCAAAPGVLAALVLLTRAENADAPGADDFPSLVALASTSHTLWAALKPRRAQLAAACWLRAFGGDTLGACAAWQRIEQLGGTAFEARWRWLHALRTGKAVCESTVEHALPTKKQLQGLDMISNDYKYLFPGGGDSMPDRSWHLCSPAFVAVGGFGCTPPLEAFVCPFDDVPCRFTVALRTGAMQHVEIDETVHQCASLSAFGGIGAECISEVQSQYGPKPALIDLTAAAKLHVLSRTVAPLPPPADRTRSWASRGAWSADGTRLALWGEVHYASYKPNPPADASTIAVYVFDVDPAHAPPAGPLTAAQTLLLPNFKSLALGSGSGGARIYTLCAEDGENAIAGALQAWDVASGTQLADMTLVFDEPKKSLNTLSLSVIVPFRSELCITLRTATVHVRCATTLAPVAQLAVPPLRGGHGERVTAMCGVGDVLLSCDAGGVLLAWDVPTRTLLRRLGRDVIAAPPARGVYPYGDAALALTARGAASLETDFGTRSQTRLYDWLP